MSRFVWVSACFATLVLSTTSAQAQAPTPPVTAPPVAAATPKTAPTPAPSTSPSAQTKQAEPKKPIVAVGQPGCTRLPLSDIQFTQEKTIEVARMRLGEYAQKVATQRGWKAFRKSDETVSCEVYLYLGPLGTEYKCLVTATFCPGPAVTAAAKAVPTAKPAATAQVANPAVAPPIAKPTVIPPASLAPSAAPKAAVQ